MINRTKEFPSHFIAGFTDRMNNESGFYGQTADNLAGLCGTDLRTVRSEWTCGPGSNTSFSFVQKPGISPRTGRRSKNRPQLIL